MKDRTAQEAFEYLYKFINKEGFIIGDTKTVFNEGFYILNPMQNIINTDFRKWSKKYAEREWEWYLSGNPDASEISKHAPIWKKHMDEKGEVRSNYGWQWNRHDSLRKVINKIKENKNTRQAVLSIYDSKEILLVIYP